MPNPGKQEKDINQDDFTIEIDPKAQTGWFRNWTAR